MREIKFRAWDNDEEVMYEADECIISFDAIGNDIYIKCASDIEALYSYELMQYTGLKDINGKEIYEGDIVKIQTVKVNEQDYIIGKVVYSEYEGMYLTNKGYILGRVSHRTEVIGNIYENKDLLGE